MNSIHLIFNIEDTYTKLGFSLILPLMFINFVAGGIPWHIDICFGVFTLLMIVLAENASDMAFYKHCSLSVGMYEKEIKELDGEISLVRTASCLFIFVTLVCSLLKNPIPFILAIIISISFYIIHFYHTIISLTDKDNSELKYMRSILKSAILTRFTNAILVMTLYCFFTWYTKMRYMDYFKSAIPIIFVISLMFFMRFNAYDAIHLLCSLPSHLRHKAANIHKKALIVASIIFWMAISIVISNVFTERESAKIAISFADIILMSLCLLLVYLRFKKKYEHIRHTR